MNRRLFLLGLGATVAAAAELKALAGASPEEVVRTPSLADDWLVRRISEFQVSPRPDATQYDDTFVKIELRRSTSDLAIVSYIITQRSYFLWRAPPGQELYFTRNSLLEISVEPGDVSEIRLTGGDKMPDGRYIPFMEKYAWPGPHVERMALCVPGTEPPLPEDFHALDS